LDLVVLVRLQALQPTGRHAVFEGIAPLFAFVQDEGGKGVAD
jgi:hypothetical protein